MFYIAQNNSPTGPFSRDQIAGLVKEGRVNASTLVVPVGGSEWEQAGRVVELSRLFERVGSGALPASSLPTTGKPKWTAIRIARAGAVAVLVIAIGILSVKYYRQEMQATPPISMCDQEVKNELTSLIRKTGKSCLAVTACSDKSFVKRSGQTARGVAFQCDGNTKIEYSISSLDGLTPNLNVIDHDTNSIVSCYNIETGAEEKLCL
ncbi:DUF4339 domain-containing protein [Magnetospirillum sp. 15-1]|uniref:DUF4339 domain-containing protein n=1 Tax=Magnetospirillum sp. 15-1 TaxID=1979370 RepID=UPI001143FB26|nr:DUF4339 domain-containing protein [Magnetospirillum sp. 15-1]